MLLVYCDGGAAPNPGHGGIGFIIKRNDKIICDGYQYLGNKITNNQAEFVSIINALSTIWSHYKDRDVQVFMDSQLVVKSSSPNLPIRERFSLKDEKLIKFQELLEKLIAKFHRVSLEKITREENKLADKLCQIAIQTKGSKTVQYSP